MSDPMTPAQTLAAFKAEGVKVAEHHGWKTRCRCCPDGVGHRPAGPFIRGWGDVNGQLAHITAGGLGNRSVTAYIDGIINGDPKTPCKSHTVIGLDGTVYLNSAGRCNHAGKVGSKVRDHMRAADFSTSDNFDNRFTGGSVDGNSFTYGDEVIAASKMNAAQYASLVKVHAARARFHGWDGGESVGHGEVSNQRGAGDPNLDMGKFRRDVMAQLKAGPATTAPKPTKPPVTPPTPPTKQVVRHFGHRHLNTWGDDGAKGTATLLERMPKMVADLVSGTKPEVITLNEVRSDQVPSWRKRLGANGYDVVLAEDGNLVALEAGSEVAKAQSKFLPSSVQGEGRREALGMVRAKINGHWEHIFVSHLDYRSGAKFDAIRVKQAAWIASEESRWAEVWDLGTSWQSHTTLGIDENSDTWTRDKAFKPAGIKAAGKSGIDAIYGNRSTSTSRTIATASDHPIIDVVYVKTVTKS